jgi:hypothetical protein
VGAVLRDIKGTRTGVAEFVAADAGGDDVAGTVTAAVLAGREVFGGALKMASLVAGKAVFCGEGVGLVQPHCELAIEATALLGRIGFGPISGEWGGH